ncbi:DEP domain-containing protein 4 [Conger conger]|uniref:DEP domain-containing protein 4 n=1 Tax=Conger conger TaxID=82655 RepID=UPI002A5AE7C6|nr:DEP domain-containing protein 4 [Conger conger]
MAVDLTPRFRRLNSQTRSMRENAQIGSSGPFRATQLWRSLILALHSQLEVRPRRKHLRTHSDCFTGSDAVDVLLSHLMQNIYFCSSEVSRLKATRLCQALMEARVFEPVGTKLFRRQKDAVFEDSSCSLYRFLDRDALPGSNEKQSGEEDMRPDEISWRRRKNPRLDQLRTISNPLAMESSDRRLEKLLQTINLHPSTPSALMTAAPASFLSKTVVEEVWKQQTFVQLLQIVELPILDCILTSPGKTELQRAAPLSNHTDLVISNTCVDREVTQSLNLPEMDFWLAAAADCLEHFPDQLIVVAGEHLQQGSVVGEKSLSAQKRLLFDAIAKYYSGQERAPLLTGRYLDIHIAILELLDCGKQEHALTASQLCLRLLQPDTRAELHSLLGFMAAAAQPESVRLHRQADNRATVVRTFLKAIVQSNALTRTQSEELVLFLMDNQSQLFKTPASLTEAVGKTLQALQQGGDADITTTFSFCQRVTVEQYEDQREKATLESLKQLIRHISLSASMPLKDKRRLIKDFQKHHPVVFLQHFSSTF